MAPVFSPMLKLALSFVKAAGEATDLQVRASIISAIKDCNIHLTPSERRFVGEQLLLVLRRANEERRIRQLPPDVFDDRSDQ